MEPALKITDIDGVNIAYETHGEGPPIVFLHCWAGNSNFYYKQLKEFSKNYRCIALDFPGHGRSGGANGYSVEFFAEVTADLLEKLGVESAVLVGHSLGGMVALYTACERPDIVRGLVLLDTSAKISTFLAQRLIAKSSAALGKFASRRAKAAVAALAATHPLSNIESKVITGRECSRTGNKPVVETIKSIEKFDVSRRLHEIKVPALIVVGNADILADVRHAKLLAKGLGNSTLKIVKGAGHMTLFERPESVNSEIEFFLKRTYPAN